MWKMNILHVDDGRETLEEVTRRNEQGIYEPLTHQYSHAEALKYAEEVINFFNSTLRPWESRRELISVFYDVGVVKPKTRQYKVSFTSTVEISYVTVVEAASEEDAQRIVKEGTTGLESLQEVGFTELSTKDILVHWEVAPNEPLTVRKGRDA